jgi:hypothetical protein
VVGICYGLFCGEWWKFVMVYCVGSGGNLLMNFRDKLSVPPTGFRRS